MSNSMFLKYCNVEKYTPPRTPQNVVRLNLNENLFGPSPKCQKALESIELEQLCFYDLEKSDFLEEHIANILSLSEENVWLHNGSSEVIRQILEMIVYAGDVVLLPNMSWSYYQSVCNIIGADVKRYSLIKTKKTFDFSIEDIEKCIEQNYAKVVIITSPNMPTGNVMSEDALIKLISNYRDVFFVVDQAYWGFSDFDYNISDIINQYDNVVFIRTFSKYFGLANERIGFCICNSQLKRMFECELPLFRISYTSRKVAQAAISDMNYYNNIKRDIKEQRDFLISELDKMHKITVYLSEANFVLCEVEAEEIEELVEYFQNIGHYIRVFQGDNGKYIRITIGPRRIMKNVIRGFTKYLSE